MTSLRLARRNLARHPGRLVASIGGIALALTLTLSLNAIYAGVANGITQYIDHAGADIWVSQAGVRNLHMVASWMPEAVVSQVRQVPGVADATPILYVTDTIVAGGQRGVAYVIGRPPGASVGGPWALAGGTADPSPGTIVLDAGFAGRVGVGIGDQATVMGRTLRIVGLTRGTESLLNSVAFMSFDDFRAAHTGAPVVSFVLVRVGPGADPATVSTAIAATVPDVSVQTAGTFSAAERRLIADMSADVVAIMNSIGFIAALAVVALTMYTVVLAGRRELAMLRAIGASHRVVYASILLQAALLVAASLLVAITVTAIISVAVPALGFPLAPAITVADVLRSAIVGGVVAIVAAIVPVRIVARIDPATALRPGGSGA